MSDQFSTDHIDKAIEHIGKAIPTSRMNVLELLKLQLLSYQHMFESHGIKLGIQICLDEINKISSEDIVEVKHGKWIDGDGNYVPFYKEGVPKGSCDCSVCGRWLTASDEYDVYGNFCPYCGADMREGKESNG